VCADLVPERLLRILLARHDEHGHLPVHVDLADVLFLERSALRVAVQPRDGPRLHVLAETEELLAGHLGEIGLLRRGRRGAERETDRQNGQQQQGSPHGSPPL